MTIDRNVDGKVLTVIPHGRLDSSTSDAFCAFVEENFTADFEKLSADFGDVDYISSKGLRIMVYIYKHLDGRKIEVTGANASVREVFRISGLSEMFCLK